jgi:hypothetical protein
LIGAFGALLIVVGGLLLSLSLPGERAYFGTVEPRNGALATVEGAQGGTLAVHARGANGAEVSVEVWTQEAFRSQYAGGLCTDPQAPCAEGPVAQANGTEVNLSVVLPETRPYIVAIMNYEQGNLDVTFEIRREYFHPYGFVGGVMIAGGALQILVALRRGAAAQRRRTETPR